jgi:hypothetical protein
MGLESPVPSAVDLHYLLTEDGRTRSGSGLLCESKVCLSKGGSNGPKNGRLAKIPHVLMVKRCRLALYLHGRLVGRSGGLAFCNIRLLDASKSTSPSRPRIRQLRRPNTSDSGSFTLLFLSRGVKLLTQFGFSVSSNKSPSPFPSERAHHQISHSASAVNTHSQSKDDITITSTTFTPSFYSFVPFNPNCPSISQPFSYPTSDDPTPSDHVSSRCTTAPAVESFADVLVANGKHGQHQQTHEDGFLCQGGMAAICICLCLLQVTSRSHGSVSSPFHV